MTRKKKILLISAVSLSLLIILTLLNLPLITAYYMPFYFRMAFNRTLSFKKAKYDFIRGRLFIEKIEFSEELTGGQSNVLFKINKLSVDIDMLKMLAFKPSVSSIIAEDPETYIIKDKNGDRAAFCRYFDNNDVLNKSKNKAYKLLSFVNSIRLINGSVYLKDGIDQTEILKNFTVIIPGISRRNNADSEIRGLLFGEEFNIKGITQKDKDSITDIFQIKIIDFDLNTVQSMLPHIKNLNLRSGLLSTDLTVSITSYRTKPLITAVKGVISVNGLKLKHLNTIEAILKSTDIKAEINNIDLKNKIININKITVSGGQLFLSDDLMLKKDINFNIPDILFTLHADSFDINNFKFLFKESGKTYSFTKYFISFRDIDFNQKKELNAVCSVSGDGLDYFKSVLRYNLNSKALNMDEITVKNLNILKFKKFLKNDFIKNGYIKSFEGSIAIFDNSADFKGILFLNNIDASYNDYGIQDLSCIISSENNMLKIGIERDRAQKISGFALKDKLLVKKIKTHLFFMDSGLLFTAESISADYNVNYNPSKKSLTGSALIDADSLKIYDQNTEALSIRHLNVNLADFDYPELNFNIKEIKIDEPVIGITMSRNKKLFIGTAFDISRFTFKNSLLISRTKNSEQIREAAEKIRGKISVNSDKLTISGGKINFTDLSPVNAFNIFINDINAVLTDYPSKKGLKGQFDLQGQINGSGKFVFNSYIHENSEIYGSLKTQNFNVKPFSPYFEYYISHSIVKGSLNLDSDFQIKNNELDMSITMHLSNLKMIKSAQNDITIFSFVNIADKIDKNNGNLKMIIPVKGKINAPEVDFKKIFFKTFIDLITGNKTDGL